MAPIGSLCTAGPLLAAGGVQLRPTVLLGALKWPCCSCLCPVMPSSAFPPRDGLLHGPSAAAEDVTGSASSKLMFSEGFDTEWDKGQLLKGERVGLRARSLLLPPKPEGVRAAWGSWLALLRVALLRVRMLLFGVQAQGLVLRAVCWLNAGIKTVC